MTIELKPELEILVQKRLQSGAFASPEEVVEHALAAGFPLLIRIDG